MPLRSGVIGATLGYAGFSAVRSYVGKPDIFGRKFKFSETNIADSLATAAVMVMGEGAERQPLTHIIEAPVEFRDKINKKELQISIKDDMYRPLFQNRPKN